LILDERRHEVILAESSSYNESADVESKMRTRRELLKTAAAAAGLVEIAKAYTPKVLTPDQMESVAKLVDLIIPRSDTPGASDAGVPAYIDRAMSRNARTKARFLEGLSQLEAKGFFTASVESQTEMLTAISKGKFFKLVKDLTIDGYYTSKPGLTVELGWDANTFLTEFKGCTHPGHQV
jgi:hypothetical protein